jgi:hypothetical protein
MASAAACVSHEVFKLSSEGKSIASLHGVLREGSTRQIEGVGSLGRVHIAVGINRDAFARCALIHAILTVERRDEPHDAILTLTADLLCERRETRRRRESSALCGRIQLLFTPALSVTGSVAHRSVAHGCSAARPDVTSAAPTAGSEEG